MEETFRTTSRFKPRRDDSEDDLIVGYQILAALDFNTRAICRSLDGKVFAKKTGPRPPFYEKCRCCAAPVTKTLRELGFDLPDFPVGTRASIRGQVSATLTYYDWLAQQRAFEIERVLGQVRANVFLHGGLTPKAFAELQLDQNYRERTLAEFMEVAPLAFIRSGIFFVDGGDEEDEDNE